MKCQIVHQVPGRMRCKTINKILSIREADILENYLLNIDGINTVIIHERTGSILIKYSTTKDVVVTAIASFSFNSQTALTILNNLPSKSSR